MSTPPAPAEPPTAGSSSSANPTPKPSEIPEAKLPGWARALEHTGIPTSWLRRPRLPSPRMMAFIVTVAGIGGTYYYDRRQCKLIRQEYIDKVKHLADEPLPTWEKARKVKVYACKWPGDEQYDRSLIWFKKYIKPILVAAAVDYEFKNGNQHGSLMRAIADEIRDRRRVDMGIDEVPPAMPLPGPPRKQSERERELDGGIIVIGRHTFKEYMEGLRRGWTGSLEKKDPEETLARVLENDGHFDEPLPPSEDSDSAAKDIPTGTSTQDTLEAPKTGLTPIVFSPLQLQMPPPPSPPPSQHLSQDIPPHLNVPPARIPDQPPLLLVPYTSLLGFRNIPLMILGFFNHRKDVRLGAEAAYRIIAKETRPFDDPSSSPALFEADAESTEPTNVPGTQSAEALGDLAFDHDAEHFFRPSYDSTSKEIEKSRARYYKELPPKLVVARSLARGEREPTKDEKNYPPPTEVQLRAERLKKEKKWREELDAWDVLKKDQPVAWDERFRGAFKVYVDGEVPPPPPKVDPTEELAP
ncbi:mitochondrial import inner membrane translocase subunit tim54 [Tulasnella sp. 403]|nr:mitochondrial import inner membrane translocase subunit tim54 [Tulasnella sp. 403]